MVLEGQTRHGLWSAWLQIWEGQTRHGLNMGGTDPTWFGRDGPSMVCVGEIWEGQTRHGLVGTDPA
jgi:hypothetical protein